MHCVILHPKETTRNVIIPALEKTLPSAASIGTLIRRSTPPEYIGSWKWSTTVLHLFGYKTGKAGTENKHELPPPHDTTLLFGEAVVVATKNNAVVDFVGNDYLKFYNEQMGGFEDLGSEDSEEEEEEEENEIEEEETEEVAEEEEEEEEVETPVVVKVQKPKRGNKKLPAWFSQPELEKETYDL